MSRTRLDPLQTCVHLRAKHMFYETSTTRAAGHDAEVERLFGACDTTQYWCSCTQGGRGPDQEPAGSGECSLRGRSCFVGIADLV